MSFVRFALLALKSPTPPLPHTITHTGVREVVLCKDQKGKCGISLFHVNKGVFVCFVAKGSPAAMAGVRFGDQILTVSCV